VRGQLPAAGEGVRAPVEAHGGDVDQHVLECPGQRGRVAVADGAEEHGGGTAP
jgi:hypothetical protein